MDLSFPPPIAAGETALPAADLALLVAARTEVSATAKVQALIDGTSAVAPAQALLAPASGAFNAAMAARLSDWSDA